jgi:hypothetical protein
VGLLAFAVLVFAASVAVFELAPPTHDRTAAISAAASAAAAASNGNTGSNGAGGDTCANDDDCRNANIAAAAAAAEAGVQSAALWKVALEALVLAVTVQKKLAKFKAKKC